MYLPPSIFFVQYTCLFNVINVRNGVNIVHVRRAGQSYISHWDINFQNKETLSLQLSLRVRVKSERKVIKSRANGS